MCEIRSTKFFSIRADEATDVACNAQICVAIRWVSQDYEIFEEPLGLFQLPKTDAATIFGALQDVLVRCILPIKLCRGKLMMEQPTGQVIYVEWLLILNQRNQRLFMFTA